MVQCQRRLHPDGPITPAPVQKGRSHGPSLRRRPLQSDRIEKPGEDYLFFRKVGLAKLSKLDRLGNISGDPLPDVVGQGIEAAFVFAGTGTFLRVYCERSD
jgi:hypothetical protein